MGGGNETQQKSAQPNPSPQSLGELNLIATFDHFAVVIPFWKSQVTLKPPNPPILGGLSGRYCSTNSSRMV
ncbi:UNVERIFIED_CONTAM: hypothetical protein BEN50_07955 [Euhalothece sp. KZN 001]